MGIVILSGVGASITKPADPVFANNTWEDIIRACQSGSVPGTWKVGDKKTMRIGSEDYDFDIIGKNHDSYYDGSGVAPLTFQMHDTYNTVYNMYSSGDIGWADTDLRKTTLPTIMALMPSAVQGGIRNVAKLCATKAVSGKITTVSDKLFLLSEEEVFGKTTYSLAGQGAQYEYYSAGNSKRKIKPSSGSYVSWFTRSPRASSGGNYAAVSYQGAVTTFSVSGYQASTSFAFCF